MADLRKLQVPAGALRVEVDDPLTLAIEQPVGVIRGWFAVKDGDLPEEFDLRLRGVALPYQVVTREDVEDVLDDHHVQGFAIPYDLADYLPYIQDGQLIVDLTIPGYDRMLLRFKVTEKALAICLAAAGDL